MQLSLKKSQQILAKVVSEKVNIPIIGIGAGPHVDGQVLVTHDMLGITKDFQPRFLRTYADLYNTMKEATKAYINDIKTKDFPNDKEQY